MPAEEISCQELVEVVTDYLQGALPVADRERLEAHLVQCPGCTVYLDQIRRTIALTGHLHEEQMSDEVKTRLSEVFTAWKSG